MKCPYCGSEHVQYVAHTTTSGFSGLDACCGYILMGPLGMLCGLCGRSESTKEYWVCHDCGNTFPTFLGTWRTNKDKEKEDLRQREYEQYMENKAYLAPLESPDGSYADALRAYNRAKEEMQRYVSKRDEVTEHLKKHPDKNVRNAAKNHNLSAAVVFYFLWGFVIFIGMLRFTEYFDGCLMILLGILGIVLSAKKVSGGETYLCARFPAFQRLITTINELSTKTSRMDAVVSRIKQVEQYEKKHPEVLPAPKPVVPERPDLSQDDDTWFHQWLSSEGGSEF